MSDWSSISLCNVIHKLLSKGLANRLKVVLPSCISIEKSTFVSGRSIMDNVSVATEIVHYMQRKTRVRVGDISLKSYISKAYDWVEWGYLRAMREKNGLCYSED